MAFITLNRGKVLGDSVIRFSGEKSLTKRVGV